MKKRRPPEDPFDQALQAEQTFNPHQVLRIALRRQVYARIVIPPPGGKPAPLTSPFLAALKEEYARNVHAVHYDLHFKLVQSMRKPQ